MTRYTCGFLLLIISLNGCCWDEESADKSDEKSFPACEEKTLISISSDEGYFCSSSHQVVFNVSDGLYKDRWNYLLEGKYPRIQAKDLVVKSKLCGNVSMKLELSEFKSGAIIESIEEGKNCSLREGGFFQLKTIMRN